VSLDRYQGIVWLVRAAEQGDASALASIGRAYSLGIALPKDEQRALFWMAAAIPRASDIDRNQSQPSSRIPCGGVNSDDVRRIGREAEQWSPGAGASRTMCSRTRQGGVSLILRVPNRPRKRRRAHPPMAPRGKGQTLRLTICVLNKTLTLIVSNFSCDTRI
jgi:hypothetical protein